MITIKSYDACGIVIDILSVDNLMQAAKLIKQHFSLSCDWVEVIIYDGESEQRFTAPWYANRYFLPVYKAENEKNLMSFFALTDETPQ